MNTGVLLRLALRMASTNGEPNPAEIAAVRTTRSAAEAAISGAQPGSSEQAVWVIQMTGEFVGYMVKGAGRPHRPFPTGRAMVIVVENDTAGVRIWSIRKDTLDLSALGVVRALRPDPL